MNEYLIRPHQPEPDVVGGEWLIAYERATALRRRN